MSGHPTAQPAITPREQLLIDALRAIVIETMDFPPQRPCSADSFLDNEFVAQAQAALAGYGENVPASQVFA
jgi:hypothetical protein